MYNYGERSHDEGDISTPFLRLSVDVSLFRSLLHSNVADVFWAALRGRPIGCGICQRGPCRSFRFGCIVHCWTRGHGCSTIAWEMWKLSSDTFKQQCFPLASMPSQSNTRDRPYSPFKRFNIMQHQFDTGYVNNNMQNKQVW